MSALKQVKSRTRSPMEVVLGAGGSKGPCLLGFLDYLEETNVQIGTLTGVSIGSVVAAIYSNVRDARKTREIFLAAVASQDFVLLLRTLVLPLNPLRWFGGFVDLVPLMRKLVETYDLKPNKDLRIIAYDVARREPVVFEGENYDLAEALAASCTVPGVFRPVWYNHPESSVPESRLLVDGGVHHFCPGEFCKGRAIIAKLGLASKLPSHWMTPINIGIHIAEMVAAPFIDKSRVCVPDGDHIVVDVAKPDVGGMTFGLPLTTDLAQIRHGYEVAKQHLASLIAAGDIPVSRKTARA